MAASLLFWFLSPVLGIISVVLSLYLADLNCLSVESYKTVLSSLYFIAVSTSAVANTEAFELAFRSDPADQNEKVRSIITAAYIFNVLFFLILVAIFSKTVKLSISDKFQIGAYDLLVASFCIVLSTTIGLVFKVQLERVRRGV